MHLGVQGPGEFRMCMWGKNGYSTSTVSWRDVEGRCIWVCGVQMTLGSLCMWVRVLVPKGKGVRAPLREAEGEGQAHPGAQGPGVYGERVGVGEGE